MALFRTSGLRPFRASPPTATEASTATALAGVEQVLARPVDIKVIEGQRGGYFEVYSNGLNDETATLTFYGVDVLGDVNAPQGYRIKPLGAVAITLSTKTGANLTLVEASSLYADTLVWTVNAFHTAKLTTFGGNTAAFSPADNTIGHLAFSDFGNHWGITWRCTTYGLTAGSVINTLWKQDV